MTNLIFRGNIKLLLCFAFYLSWWIVAFNPKRPIRGFASGWLLIPAFIFGILALLDIIRGIVLFGGPLPGLAIAAFGVVSYAVLLSVTSGLLHRPVTSELLIIVLWTTVAMLEVNTLLGLGVVASEVGLVLVVLCLVFTAASIVCYQLFYSLESTAAFVDGAIPLVLAGVMTGAIAFLAR